ncbi:hypothetical protein T439DRAFT_329195 [Meredithblackwellia eburnea MCA 4105]
MVSDRSIRIFHPILFLLISLASIITLAISASLVAHYNSVGYPDVSYRDRIRICLAAAIWMTLFALYLLVGVMVQSGNILFGIASHLFSLGIGFILLIIGVSSLTALTDKTSCSHVLWSRCRTVKGLVAITWIDTIFVFIALLCVFGLGIKSRSGAGIRRSTLADV